MSLELKGRIKEIGDVQSFNDGAFQKKQILLTVKDGAYTQDLPIDVSNKNLAIFDSFNVGDSVMVDINLRSNEWQGKHYPSINGWRVVAITDETADVPKAAVAEEAPTTAADPAPADPVDDADDDLPF
jgi:hypothetical protein